MDLLLWIVLGVALVAVLFLWVTYNGLVKLKVRVEEAWSDITVQLKRRADLIPNLIESVKGYAAHEKEVFEKVTEARTAVMNATSQGPKATAAAENQFEGALKSLFAVSEELPTATRQRELPATPSQLVDTEDKIQASRRFYNGGVRDLNTKVEQFPSNLIASMFGFVKREFFEVDGCRSARPGEVLVTIATRFIWEGEAMYSAIAANKRNTVFIMALFIVLIAGLGWVASLYYGVGIFWGRSLVGRFTR